MDPRPIGSYAVSRLIGAAIRRPFQLLEGAVHVLKKILAAGIAILALGLLTATDASADNDAEGALMISSGGSVGDFEFDPVGEKVRVYAGAHGSGSDMAPPLAAA
jgi:hypothetical protein